MNHKTSQSPVQTPADETCREPSIIDIHAHFLPEFYRLALVEAGHQHPDGIPYIPEWSAERHLECMDRLGIATAILSVSSPGVHFGDDIRARQLSRRINDEGRRLCDAYPERFGFFASLPLPDVQGAIAEATRALDVLNADGIVVETNHHGVYLGDPCLEPLYSELNRRAAVVFVHPTSPQCSCCERLDRIYPRPMLEFVFETTRSITDLVLSGVPNRYPDIRFVVPHAGAVLPAVTERVEMFRPLLQSGTAEVPSLRDAMQKLHFDLAGAPVPIQLGALLELADPMRLHYGSDFPFTPENVCAVLLAKIGNTEQLEIAERARILRENSIGLFPRFASR